MPREMTTRFTGQLESWEAWMLESGEIEDQKVCQAEGDEGVRSSFDLCLDHITCPLEDQQTITPRALYSSRTFANYFAFVSNIQISDYSHNNRSDCPSK